MKLDYKEETLYVRRRKTKWEVFAKAKGRGMILSELDSKENAIRCMTLVLWAFITYGPERYGSEMAKLVDAPPGVRFPVIEEAPIE